MNSIGLILPYWGRFPNYFQFFLESIGRNPTIDLHVFTDTLEGYCLPNNVIVHLMSLQGFKAKLQDRFDFPLNHLQSPYNLCDFKPAYGFCLQEYLKEYDFWGHCDCDLIFGDIRSFLTEEVLSSYDRFLTRGHLSVYRNNERTNRAFMEIAPVASDYKNVFSSSSGKVWAWDEWGGVSRFWSERRVDRQFDEIIFDDINSDYIGFLSSQKMTKDVKLKKSHFIYAYNYGRLERIGLQNGNIIKEATCYVHLQKRHLDVVTDNYGEFWIVPNKICAAGEMSVSVIRSLGGKRGLYWPSVKRRGSNFLRKISRILNKC